MTSSDSASSDVAPPHVAVVAIASTPAVEVLVSELRRDAMRVDVGDLELLRAPPAAPVYLCVLGAQIGTMIAEQVVAWAQSSELRPGKFSMPTIMSPRLTSMSCSRQSVADCGQKISSGLPS